ncbi:hypothetical protein TVAG_468620 [Trichomonas vaginalis G3]|uniref:Ubiquitin-like domain-containing protein n=1 Tax=Trichomonas vaginalis (strain ATCC PRA-98 / G3) TaxID=412133 RepID=A2F5W7_TRIV3|nr:ubiquitin-like family [Trichomonas vaginalis G3]EAX99692.1 hypothetical protein TVAG_468620 [Trichomonas vaginalis G3]KAI5494127.1 ubiquitin-like family [Trichomonas vaginalis G3]|eukprot:XP_001312622.1 hypothetical protein [Trichomonas vaginalis G3]
MSSVTITTLDGNKFTIDTSKEPTYKEIKDILKDHDKFKDQTFTIYFDEKELEDADIVHPDDITDEKPLIIVLDSQISEKTFCKENTFDNFENLFERYSYATISYGRSLEWQEMKARKAEITCKSELPEFGQPYYDEFVKFKDIVDEEEQIPETNPDILLKLPRIAIDSHANSLVFRNYPPVKRVKYNKYNEIPSLTSMIAPPARLLRRHQIQDGNNDFPEEEDQLFAENNQENNENNNHEEVQNPEQPIQQDVPIDDVHHEEQNLEEQNQNQQNDLENNENENENNNNNIINNPLIELFARLTEIRRNNRENNGNDPLIDVLQALQLMADDHRELLGNMTEENAQEQDEHQEIPIFDVLRRIRMIRDAAADGNHDDLALNQPLFPNQNIRRQNPTETEPTKLEMEDIFSSDDEDGNKNSPSSDSEYDDPEFVKTDEETIKKLTEDTEQEEEEDQLEKNPQTQNGRVRRMKLLRQDYEIQNQGVYDNCLFDLNKKYTNAQRHDLTSLFRIGFEQAAVIAKYEQNDRDYEKTKLSLLSLI